MNKKMANTMFEAGVAKRTAAIKNNITNEQAFNAACERVKAAKLALDEALRGLEAGHALTPKNWGYTGSMAHVATVLEELASGFTK